MDALFLGIMSSMTKEAILAPLMNVGLKGTGAVVGAGSVVSTDVPENAITIGSPIKIIGYRED